MKRLILIIVVAALFLGGLGWLFLTRGAPVREFRARQLAREALELLGEGDFANANAKANAAFQLAPEEPVVLRAAAEFNAEVGHPQTVSFYRALVETGEATEADRVEYAAWLLRSGDPFASAGEVEDLMAEGYDSPRLDELKAEISLAAGDFSGAEIAQRARLSVEPEAAAEKLRLAAILLQSGRVTAVAEAVQLLEGLAAGDSDERASASLLLVQSPSVAVDVRLNEGWKLVRAPDVELEDRLAATEALVTIDPGLREELFSELLERGSPSAEERRALGAWLVHHGEPQKAQELIPLRQALKRKDLLLVWLDAAAGLGTWEEILSVIERSNLPLEPEFIALFRGRAEEQLGRKRAAMVSYKEAIAKAVRDPEALVYVAGYLSRLGHFELAEKALDALARNPATARLALEGALQVRRSQGQLKEMQFLLEKMHERAPDDLAIANDLRYVRLVGGERGADLVVDSEKQFEEDSALPFRMTYALALLNEDRGEEALALFQGSGIPLANLTEWQKVIFASVLNANRLRDSAATIAGAIDRSQLMPQEEALLDFWMAQ